MNRVVARTVKFAIAGAVGFLVDAAVLALVLESLGPYWGRVVSFIAAATTTWAINRRLAFADRTGSGGPGKEYLRYFSVMLVGGVINYAVYAAIIVAFGAVPPVPFLGVAAGSLSGMGVNLFLAHRFVFSRPRG